MTYVYQLAILLPFLSLAVDLLAGEKIIKAEPKISLRSEEDILH